MSGTSEKQLIANKENAQRSRGPRTLEGKTAIGRNGVRHGILSQHVVVLEGGLETQEKFDRLLQELRDDLNPVGSLENILLEKIAIVVWRLRRVVRYEMGLMKSRLSDVANLEMVLEEASKTIKHHKREIERLRQDVKELEEMKPQDRSPEELSEWIEYYWDWVIDKIYERMEAKGVNCQDLRTEDLRAFMAEDMGMNDDQMWTMIREICAERIRFHQKEILLSERLEKRMTVKLDIRRDLAGVPGEEELNRLLRYQAAIEKQFHRDLEQLKALQKQR